MTEQDTDVEDIIQPVLELMQMYKMDFHSTFRHLTTFRATWMGSPASSDTVVSADSDPLHAFLKGLIPSSEAIGTSSGEMDAGGATKDWLEYLDRYAARIALEPEQSAWKALAMSQSSEGAAGAGEPSWEAVREAQAKRHNPRFVLRQWVLEEVIASLVKDADAVSEGSRAGWESPSKGRQVLNKVLEMATRPYESWGAEGREPVTEEEREEARVCGTGPRRLLGFQCSCSS